MLQHKHENQEHKERQNHALTSNSESRDGEPQRCGFHERVCFHAARAGRLRSMAATKSGRLIGLARNGCPWIWRPDLASAFVTRAVRKTTGVRCNVGSDSIRAATSPPSVSGITISS